MSADFGYPVDLLQCALDTVLGSLATVDLHQFCFASEPDFTPLGGSRPDAAVVACTAVSLFTDGLIPRDVILPPDVLDTGLAFLCAPLIVTHPRDLLGQEAAFLSPAMCVRLRTIDADVLKGLRKLTEHESCKLTVLMKLSDSVSLLPDDFMGVWDSLACFDIKRTAVQKIGHAVASTCSYLTKVSLPNTLTEIGANVFQRCPELQVIDLRNTAVRRISTKFAAFCPTLTTVSLPDTLTEIGAFFLWLSPLHIVNLKHTALQQVGNGFCGKCPNLTTVALPDTLRAVGDGFLRECQQLQVIHLKHTSVQRLGRLSLAECPNLTTVTLPHTLTEVGAEVFWQCRRLQIIDLKHTAVRRISSKFASECTNLTTVALPDTVTDIVDGFLYQCQQLQVIDLRHTGLQTVGTFFASLCPNLTTVALPDTVTQVGLFFLNGSRRVAEVCGPKCVHTAAAACR